MDLLRTNIQNLRRYVASVAWEPFVLLSRSAILSSLTRIRVGQLQITECDGQCTTCGGSSTSSAEPLVGLSVHKDAFWVRTLLFADMGFAESYMLGEISCSNLTGFFEIFILNRSELSNGTTFISSLSSSISGLARRTNTLANARLNISAHYDISNEMFAAFLSPDLTYSCPIWLPNSDARSKIQTLEDAQEIKLQRFISNARIKSSDHVLEIGTGWGSFAIAAVRETGCRITSITLSKEQKELAEKRIAQVGFTENVEVLLCDYRDLPTPREGLYDKVVSIEMLEAVGKEYLSLYFECVNRLMKPNGGIGVFQCITMPETRYEAYHASVDFIRKYIFPGGHLPSVTNLVASINSGSSGTLIVDSIENIGPHYAKTLRLWRQNFMSSFNDIIKPSLLADHAGMTEKDAELFRHKWDYYFSYCEAGFRTSTLGDVIITVAREGTTEMAEEIDL